MTEQSSPQGLIAILAGSGEMPIRLSDRLRARGRPHRILAFRGFGDRELRDRADARVGLLDVRGIEATLRGWSPEAVTLAGALRRPSPAALVGAYSALRDRDELASIAARGDDNLLRAAMELLEGRGFPLVGVRDLAPELLAEPGVYGRHQPSEAHEASISVGFRVIEAISRFDIGQAVAVAGEHVFAIEGPEGTDRMLGRVRSLRGGWFPFGRRQRGGVLVKAPKRGQDLRVDLPAIGPRTVVKASEAGLDGIVIASGLTLVLNREATVAEADRRGMFLAAIDRDGQSLTPTATAER